MLSLLPGLWAGVLPLIIDVCLRQRMGKVAGWFLEPDWLRLSFHQESKRHMQQFLSWNLGPLCRPVAAPWLDLSFLLALWSLVFSPYLSYTSSVPVISFSVGLNREAGRLPSSTFAHQLHSLMGPTPNLSMETDKKCQYEEIKRFLCPYRAVQTWN